MNAGGMHSTRGMGNAAVGQALRSSAAPEAARSQMESTLDRQRLCVMELESTVNSLVERLASVLNQSQTNATASAGTPTPMRCKLSESIDELSDRICAAGATLQDVLDRLAV